MSQQLWADAVYIKDIATLKNLPPAKIAKLACIMHEVFRAYDFSHYALQQYDALAATTHAAGYLESLVRGKSAER